METWEETELCFPQLNSSCKKAKHTLTEAVPIYSVLSLISVFTMTLNLLVIVSISHFRQLHTPTNLLLLSLAVSDCFVGFNMLIELLTTYSCWFIGDLMCVMSYVLNYSLTSASVGTMVLISADRYVAICLPLHYSTKVTVGRVTVCISLCWICSVLYNTLIMKDHLKHPGRSNSCTGECVLVLNYITVVADLILTFIIPVTVIIVLYMRVFVVAVSQARAMRCHITVITLQHPKTITAKKSELKAARTLGVVVVVFLICLCPHFLSFIVDQYSFFGVTSVSFETILFYFNSTLNPVIYAFCYPWFLKCIKHIVTLKILHESHDANIL